MSTWSSGLIVAVVVLAAASLIGVAWRRRDGRLRAITPSTRFGTGGARVTLLQFSSATCGPCRQVGALCADLAAGTDGVRHVQVDVEQDPETMRRFDVWRVPTLFVIDPAGSPVWRAVGVPRRQDLEAAIAQVLIRQVA